MTMEEQENPGVILFEKELTINLKKKSAHEMHNVLLPTVRTCLRHMY
jgi:hypothetical protein